MAMGPDIKEMADAYDLEDLGTVKKAVKEVEKKEEVDASGDRKEAVQVVKEMSYVMTLCWKYVCLGLNSVVVQSKDPGKRVIAPSVEDIQKLATSVFIEVSKRIRR